MAQSEGKKQACSPENTVLKLAKLNFLRMTLNSTPIGQVCQQNHIQINIKIYLKYVSTRLPSQ